MSTPDSPLGGAPAINRGADQWFRELGLPTFVPLRRWFTDLPRRVAPLLAWVTVAWLLVRDAIREAVDLAADYFTADGWLIFGAVVVLTLVTLAASWIAFALVRGLLRRLPRPTGIVVASLVVIACTASVIIYGYTTNSHATVSPVFTSLGVLAVCALITGMGGGALVAWATRMALRNASAIGHMASLALPVILMLVIFAFYAAEIWQVGSALSWGDLGLVGLVVGALAIIVVLRVCASEIDDMKQSLTRAQRVAMLRRSPAADRAVISDTDRPLGIVQRGNILLVMAVAQLLQALFFAFILWVILVVLGAISVPPGLVSLWVGPGTAEQPLPVEFFIVGNTTLPITINLFKTAGLLAFIAALPFVFSAVSEERYRERFFDPIMADMRRAVVVRDALRASPSS